MLYLLDGAKEVADVRNEDDDKFDLPEYIVSTDRSEGAGMLFPLENGEEEEFQPTAGFSAEDHRTFEAHELRPCFGLLCMVASAATAAGVGFLARTRFLLRPRRFKWAAGSLASAAALLKNLLR